MVPILCVGESREEYELGLCTEICTVQLNNALRGLTAAEVAQIVIAYEPIWYTCSSSILYYTILF